MATSFCRIETLSTLNRDLLDLPNLADKFFPLSQFMGILVLSAFETFIKFAFDFIANFFVSCLMKCHLVTSVILLSVDLCDNCLLLLIEILFVHSSFIQSLLGLNFHSEDKLFVFFLLVLLG